MVLQALGKAELKVLSKLAIDPSMRQANLARELDVTRSAVNQVWKQLEFDRKMKVRGLIDYGKIGLSFLFGWAHKTKPDSAINKFRIWLNTNPFVVAYSESMMSSLTDSRIYFEALVPPGEHKARFHRGLERFQKIPYNVSVEYDSANNVAEHMNLGLFDGSSWEFDNDFRFFTTIGLAKEYADILPKGRSMTQSKPNKIQFSSMVLAALVEKDYYSTAKEAKEILYSLEVDPLSERTLRRRLKSLRMKIAMPYVEIENIGLTKRIVISLAEEEDSSEVSNLFSAHASTFPKSRVVSGSVLTALTIDLPSTVDWVQMTASLTEIVGKTAKICTFITDQSVFRKGLVRVLPIMAQSNTDA